MGYYNDISNNKDLAAQNVAQYNRMRGISGHTTAGVVLSQTLPSVFMTLTAKIAESKSAKEKDETENTSEDAERTRLQKELSNALNDIGAKSEKDINTVVIKATEARNKVSSKLEILSQRLVIIPQDYLKEALAYEFEATYQGYTYYVYIDAKTGEQLKILRVIQTDNGDLLL